MTLPMDSHVHTEWSWDTGAPPGLMDRHCARALQIGLSAVAFTDHLDLVTWQVDPSDFEGHEYVGAFVGADNALTPPIMDIDGYLACVDRCRHAYPELSIMTGAEFGEPHRTGPQARALPGFADLHRVIGSVHTVSVDWLLYEPPGLYRLMPAAEVIPLYLAEVGRMITGCDAEVLTHIDYAVRYWPKDAGPFDPGRFEEVFRQALRLLAGTGRALEINIAGGNQSWVMRWWAEEGGRAVTFGSDAHDVDWLGHDLDVAAAMSSAYGFRPGRTPTDFWIR